MKRIIGMALAVVLAGALVGCGSTGSATKTSAVAQNRENNIPDWCDIGAITTADVKSQPEGKRVWEGFINEDGMLFTGTSNFGDRNTSTSTAELNAKADIARYIEQCVATYQKQTNETNADGSTTRGLSQGVGTAVAKKISGIRRVDRFISKEDGYTYVLMFVSNKNIQSAMKDTSMSDYEKKLLEEIFPVAESEASTSAE
ncbi:MAG: hypothetical protein IJ717_05255 [Treponema sp.]|mgnify:CR=1 FL=1|nr:hypothetical protein [Treponema sp.]